MEDPLQPSDKLHVLIPGDWNPGDDVLLPSAATFAEAEKFTSKGDPPDYQLNWYMRLRKKTNSKSCIGNQLLSLTKS